MAMGTPWSAQLPLSAKGTPSSMLLVRPVLRLISAAAAASLASAVRVVFGGFSERFQEPVVSDSALLNTTNELDYALLCIESDLDTQVKHSWLA